MNNRPGQTPTAPQGNRFFASFAIALGALVFAAAFWALLQTLSPSASAIGPLAVDLRTIPPGQTKVVSHRDMPVHIRHLTPQEWDQVRAFDVADLPNSDALNANLTGDAAANADNRSLTFRTQKFVVVVPACRFTVAYQEISDFGGWFCTVEGAHFDVLGRLRKGPFETNLPIPRYALSEDGMLSLDLSPSKLTDQQLDRLLHGAS